MRRNLLIRPVILFVLLGSLVTSCNMNISGIKGSGNVTTETRNLSGEFSAIDADSGIDVELTQGPTVSVIVEADDNLHQYIKTEVKNGTLSISCEKSSFFNAEKMKVLVTMPVVKRIETSGGASVKTKNTISGEALELELSSGSEITAALEFDNITADLSSGSHAELQGKTLNFGASSAGGSSIEATNLSANDVTVQSSSGSSIEVRAAVSLEAEASSGSSVEYSGKPQMIKSNENSGGSISAH